MLRHQTFRAVDEIHVTLLPDGSARVRASSLDDEFGLPWTELRLLQFLLAGQTPAQAMDHLGLAYNQTVDQVVATFVSLGLLTKVESTLGALPLTLPVPFREHEVVPVLDAPPWKTLEAQFVAKSRPVVMTRLIDDSPACRLWTPNFLEEAVGGSDTMLDRDPGEAPVWIETALKPDTPATLRLRNQVRFPYVSPFIRNTSCVLQRAEPGASDQAFRRSPDHQFVAGIEGETEVLLLPRENLPTHYGKALEIDSSRVATLGVRGHIARLRPSQALFIPSRWFYLPRALTSAITVSMFWETLGIMHRTRLPRTLERLRTRLSDFWDSPLPRARRSHEVRYVD